MRRDRDLDSWTVFLAVADTGSISTACELVHMDASGVSRIIRALESALGGVPLFDRSMRPLKLTANGRLARAHAQAMLQAHQQLLSAIDADPMAMRGTIHVGLPSLVTQTYLLPFLLDFHRDWPDIVLKVDQYLGSMPVNFDTPRGRLDVICGYGADHSHPNIVQIHYGNSVLLPCASPLYLAAHGTPQEPADLLAHTGIILESPLRPALRYLQKNGLTQCLRFRDEICFNSAASALNATLLGAGIHTGVPALHVFEAIAQGQLTALLPGWSAPESKLFIYARPESVKLRRTQVFIERFRQYMHQLHERCQRTLEPFVGELQLNLPH